VKRSALMKEIKTKFIPEINYSNSGDDSFKIIAGKVKIKLLC